MEVIHFNSPSERMAYLKGNFKEIVLKVVEEKDENIEKKPKKARKKAKKAEKED